MNIYTRNYSLCSLPTTPKYHHMSLMKIKTQNPFVSLSLNIIPVHMMKINKIHHFELVRFIFEYVIAEIYHHCQIYKIHHQHNLSYFFNTMFDNYMVKMVKCHGSYIILST